MAQQTRRTAENRMSHRGREDGDAEAGTAGGAAIGAGVGTGSSWRAAEFSPGTQEWRPLHSHTQSEDGPEPGLGVSPHRDLRLARETGALAPWVRRCTHRGGEGVSHGPCDGVC